MIDIAKFTYRDITPISTLVYEIEDLNSLKDIEGFLFGLDFDTDPNTNILVIIKKTRKILSYSVVKEFGKYRIVADY